MSIRYPYAWGIVNCRAASTIRDSPLSFLWVWGGWVRGVRVAFLSDAAYGCGRGKGGDPSPAIRLDGETFWPCLLDKPCFYSGPSILAMLE